MNQRLKHAAPPLLLALASAAFALAGKASTPSPRLAGPAAPQGPPCPAEATSLLDGLQPGASLGPGRVESISCPDPGTIHVDVYGTSGRATLTLVPRNARPHMAPESTRRCDLFYQAGRPPLAGVDLGAALSELAIRVRQGEARGVPTGW